ncbi:MULTISPECIES: hypothetical protein [Gordonia]|uniref:hypothetical protein n=1 Tax=Gordonia TaxID=2053 RepID=UPI0002A62C7E|nr:MULTISPECIES: hypothetical protein [Gordonia]ATD72135.1 hypothetical protein CNO18_19585 [Gordonia sp. 1D]MBA5848176.1 hypothetical protein [Gordonia amicalis]MCZ0914681.1 hypothetical protein [Gordonia amicalis]MCZ4579869.1 hypothetical protein [Gordonia amicalis]MCZ4654051.1 hypothetical protein [Gordonia amicalis]
MTSNDPSDSEPPFDPEEVAAAERLDDDIAAVLAGSARPGAVEPDLVLLANAFRRAPTTSTYAAVERQVAAARASSAGRWRWSLAQGAAAVLGLLLVLHGVGNMVAGEWLSTSLGEPYNQHAMVDGGLAFMAVGAAIVVASTRRRWLPVAFLVGVPLGLVLGGRGVHEIGVFAWGAVAHGAVALAAIVLLVTYLAARRYSRRRGREG